MNVAPNEGEGVATVVVPDRQLSLAIGKEGQNVRLAAKLTGWRIDIKSASVAEAERAEAAKTLVEVETEEEAVVSEEVPAGIPDVLEPALASAEVAEPLPALDTAFIPPPAPSEAPVAKAAKKPQLRFAEDISAPGPAKPQAKSKKKKKEPQDREREEDGTGKRKPRRELEISLDDDEEY